MFYEWVYPLHKIHGLGALNVFRYITFRSAYAAITALLLCYFLGPLLIAWLKRVKLGQKVREEGPQTHLTKAGTPTMGGLLIVSAIVIPCLLWGNFHSRSLWIAIGATVWLGAIGFLDDYLRVVKGFRKGLLGRYKLVGQFAIGAIVAACVLIWPEPNAGPTMTHVPFLKRYYFDLGLLFVPFVMLVITGASNAVNLTDGLDGLASGLVAIAAIAFAGMCYLTGHAKFSEYLNTGYLPFAGELTVFCAAVLGAALGFLWYNCHPADVFMGDTGSLALGGALGIIAVLIHQPLLLVIAGGVFVMEAVSVILQRGWFRYTKKKYGTGRRIFLMAPLHHHFEKKGWYESQVVMRFYILCVLFAVVALSTLKIR